MGSNKELEPKREPEPTIIMRRLSIFKDGKETERSLKLRFPIFGTIVEPNFFSRRCGENFIILSQEIIPSPHPLPDQEEEEDEDEDINDINYILGKNIGFSEQKSDHFSASESPQHQSPTRGYVEITSGRINEKDGTAPDDAPFRIKCAPEAWVIIFGCNGYYFVSQKDIIITEDYIMRIDIFGNLKSVVKKEVTFETPLQIMVGYGVIIIVPLSYSEEPLEMSVERKPIVWAEPIYGLTRLFTNSYLVQVKQKFYFIVNLNMEQEEPLRLVGQLQLLENMTLNRFCQLIYNPGLIRNEDIDGIFYQLPQEFNLADKIKVIKDNNFVVEKKGNEGTIRIEPVYGDLLVVLESGEMFVIQESGESQKPGQHFFEYQKHPDDSMEIIKPRNENEYLHDPDMSVSSFHFEAGFDSFYRLDAKNFKGFHAVLVFKKSLLLITGVTTFSAQ